tara:strand:+ start:654 stop:1724 length:1071 start_codon:yes stop_codon:yes gene_type:complete
MKCIACDQELQNYSELKFSETSIHKLTIFDEMTIICCQDCGIGLVSKEVDKDDLSEYYNSTYGGLAKKYALSDIDSPIESNTIDSRSISQITLINTFINIDKSKKILEIGAGKGDFYNALRKLNLNPTYVTFEPQKEAQERLRDMGIETISKSFTPEDCENRENQYDLIIMSHTLEHFHPSTINKTVQSIHKMLKPGGYFFCEVPNADLNKYTNAGERVVPHLTFFSLSSLDLILKKNNFRISFLKTCGNLQYEKDAKSIIECYEKKGMFAFEEDPNNKKILRNIYYDKFLEYQAKRFSRKNKILRLIVKIIGKRVTLKIFNILGKIRNATYDEVLSSEFFQYREDAEFIRCLARK